MQTPWSAAVEGPLHLRQFPVRFSQISRLCACRARDSREHDFICNDTCDAWCTISGLWINSILCSILCSLIQSGRLPKLGNLIYSEANQSSRTEKRALCKWGTPGVQRTRLKKSSCALQMAFCSINSTIARRSLLCRTNLSCVMEPELCRVFRPLTLHRYGSLRVI